MELELFIKTLNHSIELLPKITPEMEKGTREGFWEMMDVLHNEYKEQAMEDPEYCEGTGDDLGWYAITKKLFDWLPIDIVRFFFFEAQQGKVK